ncbi:MAG: protein kinase [Chloroflexia bacterium]|nr:protein kinase [Chloroflexia bacterium]
MQELSGTQVDRYSIEEEIGRGGMARVYRAHHPGLGRDVALKVLLPEITGDEVSVARFLREARAAAKLDHPNIVPIYDTGQADGSYFIAMKLIEGRTLRALVGERELAVSEISDYLTQTASALDYAHERGIVHRDIKPENIMVDAAGKVTLTDFGIANLTDEMSVTTTGAVIGTPAYMAPEQLRGEPATPRSDIYALGILAYELLSGAPPFAGRAPYAVMLAQIDEQPEPVHQRRDGMPAAASLAVSRALEKDPGQRFPTAGEFARQFASAPDGARNLQPAGIAVAGAATIKSAAPTLSLSGGSSAAPAQVAAVAAGRHPGSLWRGPWFAGLIGVGLLLTVLFAGVTVFGDNGESAAQDDDPALLPSTGTPTAEPSPTDTSEADVAAPVTESDAVEPADEVQPPVESVPTEVVVDEPPPTEVIEEQPATAPPDDGDDGDEPGQPEDSDTGPGNPGNKPEKPDKPGRGNDKQDDKKEKNDGDDDD